MVTVRNVWFQLHWIIGISAGVVLAVVGFTGGLLSFEQPIIKLLSPGIMTVSAPAGEAPLSMEQLVARIHQQEPDKAIARLGLFNDPHDSVAVSFSGAPRGQTLYANPYTGVLLGEAHGRDFMSTVRKLHRWLLLDIGIGRPIVGVATLLLIVLALSGLYLRWPKKMFSWRTWLTFDWRQKGRSFLWHLHAVTGTWVLLFYLLAAGTGLWWSFDWYRGGLYALAGVEQPVRHGPPRAKSAPGTPVDQTQLPLNHVWQGFVDKVGQDGYSDAYVTLPQTVADKVSIRYLPVDAAHSRANNNLVLDPRTGAILKASYYADKTTGEKFMASIFPLHAGSFFGLPGTILMMLASLAMPLFAISGWLLYLKRRRNKKTNRVLRGKLSLDDTASADTAGDPVLVAYASQSGSAERWAWHSAGYLQAAGVPVVVRALGSVRPEELSGFRRALFAIASFGDGQAPDNARAFARRMKTEQAALSRLQFGLLALGDKTYENFCGFGKAVGEWLHAQGARPLFADVQMDANDERALNAWQQQLSGLTGTVPVWQQPRSSHWRLHTRDCLNPQSTGAPVWKLVLVAENQEAHWQAGDLVEVPVTAADGGEAIREYSIASVPADGVIELLVREARHEDGSLGLGSVLLLERLRPGETLSLRLRRNSSFHGPLVEGPMVLVGNGTGIAGLRSHLRERELAGFHRNWLVFGERRREQDFHYRDDIQRWQAEGHLQRLDLAFSRDQAEKYYVQHCLHEQRQTLLAWLEDGAAIYVCGDLEGMAEAVDQVLVELIGEDGVERLLEEGRYRRDVY